MIASIDIEFLLRPEVVLALALSVGVLGMALAQHLRLPSILLLLGSGVLLGPDGSNMIRPEALGSALPILVSFAVAVILFEGGLNMDIRRLRREKRAIRQLVTVGAVVTAVGGALVTRFFMGWTWSHCFLLGTLVIVTGPTVIGPLLRRVKVHRSVATVLEAEGVLIDAVGAVTAAVALELALSTGSVLDGFLGFSETILFGIFTGVIGGIFLVLVLRRRNLVPDGQENIFSLAVIFILFHASNGVCHESGIAAVTVAGVVVGNMRLHVQRELLEFKEQLTMLFIGMLFVLLAADVRMADVAALGWGGFGVVLTLMFVVRPTNVWVGTFKTDLTTKQKLFVAWIGPRGIVAAAVASLFATELERAGEPGGAELRALVFLVITCTVISAGLTGGWVARRLGLQRPTDQGWVILGANALARTFAKIWQDRGGEVLLVDSNSDAVAKAQEEGLRVVFGNGLQERTLLRCEIDSRAGAMGLTPNDEVNLMFLQSAHREGRLHRLLYARSEDAPKVESMLEEIGADHLFGRSCDVGLWSVRCTRGLVERQVWEFVEAPEEGSEEQDVDPRGRLKGPDIALFHERDGKLQPVTSAIRFRLGDRVTFLVHTEQMSVAEESLQSAGWARLLEATEGDDVAAPAES